MTPASQSAATHHPKSIAKFGPAQSLIEAGPDSLLVDVECRITNGLPAIVIVGFANRSIEEAKERLRGAFNASHLELPRKRICLNLAPGDVPKDGTGFDLAMAVAILASQQSRVGEHLQGSVLIGELSLDGSVRPVRGIIGKLLAARSLGVTRAFIPAANLAQAELVPDLKLLAVSSLGQLLEYLLDLATLPSHHSAGIMLAARTSVSQIDLQVIAGQKLAKRALEIAAAGGHNLLFTGPPGTGKTMLAKALPGLLPPLKKEEILEVTQLHSLASLRFDRIITERPFRHPHHSLSLAAMVGGGGSPTPGEISLSHHGVLFLDELAEFQRSTIEALRQPLDDGVINVARNRQTTVFPAQFLLVATTNPCPCGFFEGPKPCTCLPARIVQYQRKLSGPILDRLDLTVRVKPTVHQEILRPLPGVESSQQVRERIATARQRQLKRQNQLNSQLDNSGVKRYAQLTRTAEVALNQAAGRSQLSGRAYLKVIKISRTIADLAGSSRIELPHITEALQYRYEPSEPL